MESRHSCDVYGETALGASPQTRSPTFPSTGGMGSENVPNTQCAISAAAVARRLQLLGEPGRGFDGLFQLLLASNIFQLRLRVGHAVRRKLRSETVDTSDELSPVERPECGATTCQIWQVVRVM